MSINYNKLTWVLTKEGINQIREVLANPDKNLTLLYFKFGDANGIYYEPTGNETDLINPCINSLGQIVAQNISDKSIKNITMTDNSGNIIVDNNGNVIQYESVCFETILPESSCDYNIMEVGLYGSKIINDTEEEYLFALSTCSPIPKPNIDDNYVITLNYSASFISSNLLAIYNRIVLNTNIQYVSEDTLLEMSNTMLYTTGNLAEQINSNSHILGMNRATQLNEKLDENAENIYLNASMQTCITLKNIVGYNNVENYWVFRDDNSITSTQCIKDFGVANTNMSLNNAPGTFIQNVIGLAYTLNIDNDNYYQLNNLSNFQLNINNPFTLLFCFKNNNVNESNTFLSKQGVFEIMKEYSENMGVRFCFNMYGENNSILKSSTPYFDGTFVNDTTTLIVSYNGNVSNPIINFFINSSCISTTLSNGITNINNFTSINTNTNPICSYMIDENNNHINNINSSVSIISKINNIFLEENSLIAKSITLLMQSYMGASLCLTI